MVTVSVGNGEPRGVTVGICIGMGYIPLSSFGSIEPVTVSEGPVPACGNAG